MAFALPPTLQRLITRIKPFPPRGISPHPTQLLMNPLPHARLRLSTAAQPNIPVNGLSTIVIQHLTITPIEPTKIRKPLTPVIVYPTGATAICLPHLPTQITTNPTLLSLLLALPSIKPSTSCLKGHLGHRRIQPIPSPPVTLSTSTYSTRLPLAASTDAWIPTKPLGLAAQPDHAHQKSPAPATHHLPAVIRMTSHQFP